ncbi:MAG: cysteine desulfurase family protein [Nitrospinales bacterium]
MIYLDHAATTPVDPRVFEVVSQSMRRDFANPGAVYRIGLDAANRVEKAREEIATLLRLPASYRIIFTSGGSESNNLFIKGNAGKKAACLGLEHPSVTAPLALAEEKGGEILSGFQKEGRLDPAKISELGRHRIRLLCLSHVNNELGSINDPGEIAPILKSDAPKVRLFLDGVQAVGKIRFTPAFWDGVAGYSVSAHKINGPKGIGLLIYDSRFPLAPQIHGGQQQFGIRSGTLPVPLILGLAEALKLALERTDETRVHLGKLRCRLIEGLQDLSRRLPNLRLRFNSSVSPDHQSPAIVNFSFPPVEGEVLLHHLEEKDIFVGTGSACSAQSKKPSKILTGIGLSTEEARCSLRVSFGRQNTVEEVDVFLKEFARAYEALYPTFSRKVG